MNFRPLNPHYFFFCDVSFHRIFKMLILKSLEKNQFSKKKIIKKFKFGPNFLKMIEKCEFYPNFDFSMNFRPLNPHYFIFCDLSFHRIFKMLILKSLEKYAVFKKNNKKFQVWDKGSKNDKKKSKFYQNFQNF